MAYRIETKFTEDGDWHRVIDTKLSKTKLVTKLFFTEDEAESFVKRELKLNENEQYRIVELEDE